MALAEREMTGNLHCYLGNGRRLTMRTTIVPLHRGPFPDAPDGFVAGCLDALRCDDRPATLMVFPQPISSCSCASIAMDTL